MMQLSNFAWCMQSKNGELSGADGFGPADTEMRILEASIDKISELLAVAFGDAGVDIIAENMKCMGGLNPMVPGQRTACSSHCVLYHVTLPDCSKRTVLVIRWQFLDSVTSEISQTSLKCCKRAL